MRKIKLYIAASIDGYIARPDGDLDWLTEYPNPEKTDYGYNEFYDSVETIIMGGRTYHSILAMDVKWSYEGKTVYVVTRTPGNDTEHIKFISDNIIETITSLKSAPGKDIWLVGGGELTAMLLNNGLVDEMIITIIPTVLGGGISLFQQSIQSEWDVIQLLKFNNGVIQTTYKIIVNE